MNQFIPFLSGIVVACVFQAYGQLTITNVERLPVDSSRQWAYPRFSPDGKFIYFTDANANGIWEFAIGSREIRQITDDPQAGGAFSISTDGRQIAYRRTVYNRKGKTRLQEIVVKNLTDGYLSVIASGQSVSIPVFSQNTVVYSVQGKTKNLWARPNVRDVAILGIDNTKIALSMNGMKVILDPFKNGSYIWPELSPDKKMLVGYEMDRGAFVCDLEGRIIAKLGRRDAAVWTRSGNWLVYMDDRDDGHQILTSDLFAVTPDGQRTVPLTYTEVIVEMYPNCSPTEDKITCSSLDGALYLFSYEEK